ncbi:MAG: hypothetical protein ACRDU0_00195 [Mycobacterium sp.]
MNAEVISARQLLCLLEDTAAGLRPDTAAVELLARHDHFLHQRAFRRFIATSTTLFGDQPAAVIRWRPAMHALDTGQLPCSTSEQAVLRIAASLADDDIPVCLRSVLGSLDHTNITLVTRAITTANGS